MERDKFLQCRDEILDVLKKYKADTSDHVRVLASAINEDLAPNGHQAVITLRPLSAYHEVENKM